MGAFSFQDLGKISYYEALNIQTNAFHDILNAKQTKVGKKNNMLFFCEHEPVFTLGKNGNLSNLLISEALLQEKGISFYQINRGGDITFHGPGQITIYPVFDLEIFNMGLKKYIETLEEIIITFLSLYNVNGKRINGAAGVWLEPNTDSARKICAIGVKSSRFVTMHGLALNITTDLSFYSFIHPCGFTDKNVASLFNETKQKIDFSTCKTQIYNLFIEYFN